MLLSKTMCSKENSRSDSDCVSFLAANVSFFGRGFWYSQLELFQTVFLGPSDCPFWSVHLFWGNSIDHKKGSATPSTNNLKLELAKTCERYLWDCFQTDEVFRFIVSTLCQPNDTTHSEPERVWPVLHEPREYIRRIKWDLERNFTSTCSKAMTWRALRCRSLRIILQLTGCATAPLDGFQAVQKSEGRCAYLNFREFRKNLNRVVAPRPLNLIVVSEQI